MKSQHPLPIRLIERITGASYPALLLVWVSTVFGFALAYFVLSTISPENGLEQLIGREITHRFWNSIYFSIVTATTVGYGDIVPSGLSKILVSMQSIFAFFVFAVFITKLVSHRQELALREIHTLSFEEAFATVREGFFMMRKDFDALIAEAETTGRLSPHSWDNLTTAYREGQSLLEQIPEFYDPEDGLYTLDPRREELLQEAVHRTLHRLNHLLDVLSQKRIDWASHEASAAELREILHIVETVTPLWRQKSPSQHHEPFEQILHLGESIHTHLARALPAR